MFIIEIVLNQFARNIKVVSTIYSDVSFYDANIVKHFDNKPSMISNNLKCTYDDRAYVDTFCKLWKPKIQIWEYKQAYFRNVFT